MNKIANQLTLPLFLDLPADARAALSADKIMVIYPPDSPCATVAGQWRRLDDGSIEAYYTPAELEICRRLDEDTPGA